MENLLETQLNSIKNVLDHSLRVLVVTGAGVSAESGVPTFRGGGGASVWHGMPFEQLSSARMVNENLPLVWEWFDYRRGIVGKCEPNAAHETLAKIQQEETFEEFSIVTQNIDGLHQAAGAENVIELHGSLWQARCLSCKTKQDLREIPEDERPPVCPECFDSMRPDVILFGEAMPMQAIFKAKENAENADVCFVIGTSSLVYPAAELPLIAKQGGAKIIEINPEETPLSAQADFSIRGKAAEILPQIFDTSQTDEQSEKQVIVKIGYEGGGFELCGRKTNEQWQFWTEGSFMDFDENDDEIWKEHKSEVVEGWDEALKLLGDDWTVGHPIEVYPQFKDPIWWAFEGQRESLQMKLEWANERRGYWAEKCGKADELPGGGWIKDRSYSEGELIIVEEGKGFLTDEELEELEITREELDVYGEDENRTSKHFMLYWQEKSVRNHEASGYPLDVVSSRQLRRANAGDTLWLVTINQAGELILAGRLKVGEIVDYETAVKRLNDASLWNGGFYALPNEDNAENLRWINLKETALNLRFANSEADRFILKNGKINAQQLQTMRELIPESAKMLDDIWQS